MYEQIDQISKNAPTTLFTNSPKSGANTAGRGEYLLFQKKLRSMDLTLLENERPHSYHGKAFAVDDNISAIGSFNWDMRSAYVDTEIMLVINGEDFSREVKNEFNYYEKDASILLENGDRTNLAGKKIKKANFIKKLIAVLFVILFYPFRFLF